MKKWILIYCFAVSVYTITTKATCYDPDDRYFYMLDDNGKLHYIDSHKSADYELLEDFNVSYNLYTRKNPLIPQLLVVDDLEALNNSNFKKNVTTVFTCHGWNGDRRTQMNTELTSALLQNDDVNVIVLDWSDLAKTHYHTAVAAVPIVGNKVGQFIKWLNEVAVSYDSIHLIGFSLGGHVVGCAGRAADSAVRRITALDAAGPSFRLNPNSISKEDGQYVEIIHTTCAFGIISASGHADYFPNGGMMQPGCPSSVLDVLTCGHFRAWQLFVNSLIFENKFMANRCDSLIEAHLNMCSGDVSPMGNSDLKKFESGMFSLQTTGEWPYFLD